MVGKVVKFEYNDGQIWEGCVEKFARSQVGNLYFTLRTFVQNDVMGPVYRSFRLNRVVSWL